MTYEEHLHALADEVGARFAPTHRRPPREYGLPPGIQGAVYGTDRKVVVWEWDPNNPVAYWTGIHELGHIAQGHLDRGSESSRGVASATRERQKFETEAWEWALENALEPPTPEVRARIFEPGQWFMSYNPSSDLIERVIVAIRRAEGAA